MASTRNPALQHDISSSSTIAPRSDLTPLPNGEMDSQNTLDRISDPPTLPGVEVDTEKTATNERKITLSEEESLQHARTFPQDRTPLYICFSPDDKDNPRNFPKWKKWYISAFASWLNFLISFAISEVSLGFDDIAKQYHVSHVVAVFAGQTICALGAGFGVFLWGPLSERFGRRPTAIASQFFLFIFQVAPPLAPNIGTIFATRFLAGFLGTAPASNTGGSIHDLWVRDESGPPLSFYIVSTVSSPAITLIYTGYLIMNKGWQWTFWVSMAVYGGFWILYILTVPETRHTVILKQKAKRVRKLLKKDGLNDRIMDENADDAKGLGTLFRVTLTRPIRFLFAEPIVLISSFYNAYVFGIVYLWQGSFTLIFGPTGHGWNTGEEGLSFMGLLIGTLVGAALNPIQDRYYKRRLKETGKGCPEARMWMARWGGFLFPISLFWFAWTSYKSVHWIIPIIASGFFGLGFYIILMALICYVYDSYGTYCSSAIACLLFARNMFATFPLFGTQMYEYLGYEWASSLLGFLSLLLIPIPFVYFHKGETLRWRSKWAREHFDQENDDP